MEYNYNRNEYPCKVGDTIYLVKYKSHIIESLHVYRVLIKEFAGKSTVCIFVREYKGAIFDADGLGEYLFLSKEEAMEKLNNNVGNEIE